MKDTTIEDVRAYPISFPVAPDASVTLGIGRAVKRDAVIVRVTTRSGIVGYGEAHHARSPGAVAHLINTTMRHLVVGRDASDVVGVWDHVYRLQLGSHGMGAGGVELGYQSPETLVDEAGVLVEAGYKAEMIRVRAGVMIQ